MEWWKQKYMVARVLLKYIYLSVLQKLYQSVVHLHKNHYEIQYALHDRVYKIRTRTRRLPTQIIEVRDHEDKDITGEMRSYLGPNEDFHGQKMRPLDIGYEKICMLMRNGEEKVFTTNDYIVFN